MTRSTAEHLRRLVAFNTISDQPNEGLIGYAADFLRGHGAEIVVVPDGGGKAGLLATFGPRAPGGVVLAGHSDVVPVAQQAWTHDPFDMVERNGRLYGRGTADMKGFLAACLAMAPAMSAAALKRPIHILMSYDEETTCRGVLPTIERMVADFPPVDAVIVGEPTGMKIVTAHKGAHGYKVRVQGRPAHSSLWDQGVSAIAIAARLCAWLDDQVRQRAAAAAAPPFDPPYTTGHVGLFQGGTAVNILASECRFEWDLRTVPGDDPAAFLDAFRREADRLIEDAHRTALECSVEIVEDYAVPGLAPETEGKAERLCRQLTGQNAGEVVSYSSEAGQFQAAGLSTVLLGPGSIGQAHIADEFIELDQLDQCTAFLGRLIDSQTA